MTNPYSILKTTIGHVTKKENIKLKPFISSEKRIFKDANTISSTTVGKLSF